MKREVIEAMLEKLDNKAERVDSYAFGLPTYNEAWMKDAVALVCKELKIVLDEDPRIEAIMSYTGCSRKVAQDLIDSGEI